jgi:hypothetical protein
MMREFFRSPSCTTIQNVSLSHKSSENPYNTAIETGGVSTLERAWPH